MMLEPYDDYLEEHHPTCRGGCGELADECMCHWTWPYPTKDAVVLEVVVHEETEPDWSSDHWM